MANLLGWLGLAPSVIHQIGAIGHSNIVAPGHTLFSAGIVNPARLLAAEITHNNAALQNVGKSIVAHQPRQVIGAGLQLGTLAAPVPGIKAGGPLIARVGKGLVGGGAIGGAASAGSQLTQNGKIYLKPTLQGIGTGAVLGGATPVGVKFIQDTKSANQIGAVGKNVGRVPSEAEFNKMIPSVPGVKVKGAASTAARAGKSPLPQLPKTNWKVGQNPLRGTVRLPSVKQGDFNQAHLNADYTNRQLKGAGETALNSYNKLSPKDVLLLKSAEGKSPKAVSSVAQKAENPGAFSEASGNIRKYFDLRDAWDQYHGIKHGYLQGYFRHIVNQVQNRGAVDVYGGSYKPAYAMSRTTDNLVKDIRGALEKDIAGSSFNHAKIAYTQGMSRAFPNDVAVGKLLGDEHGAYQQLKTPYGQELTASRPIAETVNKRASSPKASGALGKYDSANAMLKYVKLGGGSFHAVTEAGNFIGQQLVSGKLFREPGSTAKVFKTFFSNEALQNETARMVQKGTMDDAQLSGLTWLPGDIKADVSVTPRGRFAKYTGIKALHDATFQREIPYMKLKTFEQRTQGLDRNNPEDLAKMRSTAKAVNAEFGGINRFISGVGPQNARRWSRVLLASDFTESKITTLRNALTKGSDEGKLAREVVAGKAILFGALATGGAALGGELAGKNSTDKINSIAGKLLDPTFNFGSYKVSLPATHPSEFTKPLKSFADGSQDKFSGLKHYATGRLAAAPSEANQLINNQDYRGQKIYGGTKNKPISGGKAAANIASGVLPIPASQGISAATGQQSIPSAIANVVGLRSYQPTPTKADKKAQAVQKTGNPDVSALRASPPKGYSLQKTSDGRFAYTLDGESSLHTSDNLKTAGHSIQAHQFANSDQKTWLTKDRYYYKDSAGDVHYMGIDAYNKKLASAAKKVKGSGTRKSSGGASRKSVPASVKSSYKTAAKIKAPKGIKISAKAPPSFRAPARRSLSVGKIPTISTRRKAV